jgi:DNA-directed RNA polymerase beta' subunit
MGEPLDVDAMIRGQSRAWSALALGAPATEEVVATTSGRIAKPETLNYRTGKPEAAGLFDADVFGPFVDTGPARPDDDAPVGPLRFGRLELAVPVLHPMFVRHAPAAVAAHAGISGDELAAIVEMREEQPTDAVDRIRERCPELCIAVLVVLPGELRPMRKLPDDRWATTSVNDLYRRVINRSNRTARLIELSAPEIIIRNERRMLAEAVDALFENEQRSSPATGANSEPLASLWAGFTAVGGWDAIADLDRRVASNPHALAGALPFRLRAAASHLFAMHVSLRPRGDTPSISLIPQGGSVPVPY